ncbi:MAG: hypothetical protein ACTSU5_02625 [Promethearchaeota archaeon]
MSKLAELLGLDSADEGEHWMISLPGQFPIKIVRDTIKVTDSAENVMSAIDELMDGYDSWEQSKFGKLE